MTEELKQAAQTQRPQNCGTGYCSCIECVMEPAAQATPEPELPFGYIHHYVTRRGAGWIFDSTWEADGCADEMPHPTDPEKWQWQRSTPFYTQPAPVVPDGNVSVPLQVLKDASEAIGHFVSDYGWGDADMQAMDNLDAYIARHAALAAAQAKGADK